MRVLWSCVRGEMARGSENCQETARLVLRARSKRVAVTVKGAGSDWVGVPAGWWWKRLDIAADTWYVCVLCAFLLTITNQPTGSHESLCHFSYFHCSFVQWGPRVM